MIACLLFQYFALPRAHKSELEKVKGYYKDEEEDAYEEIFKLIHKWENITCAYNKIHTMVHMQHIYTCKIFLTRTYYLLTVTPSSLQNYCKGGRFAELNFCGF